MKYKRQEIVITNTLFSESYTDISNYGEQPIVCIILHFNNNLPIKRERLDDRLSKYLILCKGLYELSI